MVIESFAESILKIKDKLNSKELALLRGSLSMAIQEICPNGVLPKNNEELSLFKDYAYLISRIQNHNKISETGVNYFGRPSFMTDKLLNQLINEAKNEVRPRAIKQIGHYLRLGGTIADRIALSNELNELVTTYTTQSTPTGIASYLFYEKVGDGLAAHVDTTSFSINVNINLWHEAVGNKNSFLYVFDINGEKMRKYYFKPGEIMITYGDSIVHGRSQLSVNESIGILTIGFTPRG